MKKNLKNRLARITETFGSVPIPREVVSTAFAEFCKTGDLPDDQRVALAVVQRAKRSFESVYHRDGTFDWGATMQAALDGPKREPDPILDELYFEAIFGTELIRWAARQVLRSLAAIGEDVSWPQFLNSKPTLPNFGSVGLHLLGMPQRLAKPPHTKRANELFVRIEQLGERIGRRGQQWHAGIESAIAAFEHRGQLPDDGLLRECVLADAEMTALLRHFCGDDVSADLEHLDELRSPAAMQP